MGRREFQRAEQREQTERPGSHERLDEHVSLTVWCVWCAGRRQRLSGTVRTAGPVIDAYFRWRHHAPTAAIAAPAPRIARVVGSGTETGGSLAWTAATMTKTCTATRAVIDKLFRVMWTPLDIGYRARTAACLRARRCRLTEYTRATHHHAMGTPPLSGQEFQRVGSAIHRRPPHM